MIQINTDGSCTGSGRYTGVGGWSYVILSPEDKFECENAEGAIDTTNNRMEIMGVLKALEQISACKHMLCDKIVNFYSDSKLVVDTLRKNSKFKQNRNLDIWSQIFKEIIQLEELGYEIEFTWIERQFNRRADHLATKARDKMKLTLEWDKERVWI